MDKISGITIVLDFDGTCVTHDYPALGSDIGAQQVLKKLVDNGHRLVLFTMRSDGDISKTKFGNPHGLTDAINWFKDNDIPLYGIQTNPTQRDWTTSPKAYGQLILDDTALGTPLMWDKTKSNRPFMNWVRVEEMLSELGLFD